MLLTQQLAREGKPFTVWTFVDELTRLNRDITFAGDCMEADSNVAEVLSLAV